MNEKIKQKLHNFLRWSEKYTKTDMLYLTSGGFWLTVSQVASNLLSFGLSIAYANLLSQQTFGTYKYILSIYGFLALLALPGISTAITQSVSRGLEGSFIYGMKKKIKWGFLGSLASLILASYYFTQGNTVLSVSMAIAALFLPIMDTFGMFSNFLEGKKKFRERVIYEIIINAFAASAIVATIFFTKNLFLILIAYFASYTLARILFYSITIKKFKTNKERDEKMYSFGKSLTLFQIVSNAAQYIDKILLFTILGAPQVAIFVFASALPNRIRYLFRFTGTISFPKFTNRPFEEARKALPRKLALYGLAVFSVIIIYILLAPIIFKYIFPQYVSAVLFSQVLAVTAIYTITSPIGSLLIAHKKVREIFIISLSSFMLGLAFMIVFIPIYDIWGAVIGVAANRITNIAVSFYFLRKPLVQESRDET